MCESEMRAEHGGSVVGSAGGMQAGEDIHGAYTMYLCYLRYV